MKPSTIQKIVRHYGYEPLRIGELETGYRNRSYPVELANQQKINLIIYKAEVNIIDLIQRANEIGNFLHWRGLPARYTIDRRVLMLAVASQVRYCSLYAYLPGHTIAWEAYTMDHIKLLGKTMADMHQLLQDYALPLPDQAQILQAQLLAMWEYFSEPGVIGALEAKLGLKLKDVFDAMLDTAARCQALPNQQALHMDFVRGNILFQEESELKISGVIDFEKAAKANPVLDVARTLAFLLVDCKYKPETKVRKYFLESGYQKRGGITLDTKQRELLEPLLDIFLLHDFYKFLKHNPYENLPENEHFVRTFAQLHKKGIVAKST